MKTQLYTLLFFLLGVIPAYTQSRKDSIFVFSLKQSIDYALEHQGNMLIAKNEISKAGAKVREITGIGLPQISGFGDVRDYFELPTTLIPAQFFNGPPGEFIPLKFGTQYDVTGEIDASQLLFDGTYIVGLQAARTYRELSRKGLTQSTIQTVSAVSKAYYTVLVSYWKLNMAVADATRLKKLMDETEALYKSGFSEKLDWDRIKVNFNNANTLQASISRTITLSVKLLKYQMGMPLHDSLVLSDSLRSLAAIGVPENDSTFKPEDRIEYALATTQIKLNSQLVKKDRYAYLPSLSLYGTANELYAGENLDVTGTPSTWYPSVFAGLHLSIPIFDGLQKSNHIQEDKITWQESQIQLTMLRQSVSIDVANAHTNLDNALADFKNQKENMSLAESVEHDTKIKYEAGTGSNLEVVEAETTLMQSESDYYNALYNVMLAKIDYEQARGTLYK
jgi:outer membrane protein TolC